MAAVTVSDLSFFCHLFFSTLFLFSLFFFFFFFFYLSSTLFWLHKIVLVVGQKQLRNISLGHVLQWFSDCNSLVILKSTAFPDIHLPLSAHYPVSEDFSGNFFPVA